ncbi:MAG TPA: DUF1801 domain-containing protein [Saprospiraceae bacterium]|nr:DUF1801 domain-containing protein [Saprospiraceae bacterium]
MKLAKHKDFDSFYEDLLPAEKSICLRLRDLLMTNFPELTEKFGYGVPYYWRYSRICFIYPASFPYSGMEVGVAFGFTRGHLLSNQQALLDLGDRKEVGYVRLIAEKDIQEEILLEVLHEAVLLDEALQQQKVKGRSMP